MYGYGVRVLGFFLGALGVAISAAAQTAPKVEVSAGYQFLSMDQFNLDKTLPKGWYLDVSGSVTPVLSIVFQTGGNYQAYTRDTPIGIGTVTTSVSTRVHQFLGGVRASARTRSAVTPYGHVLVGAVHDTGTVSQSSTAPNAPRTTPGNDSSTRFAFVAGGGVTVGFTQALGVRAGVDYMHVREADVNVSRTLFRPGPLRFQAGLMVGW